jgi:hypothetical protein
MSAVPNKIVDAVPDGSPGAREIGRFAPATTRAACCLTTLPQGAVTGLRLSDPWASAPMTPMSRAI